MSLWNQLVQLKPQVFENLQNIYGPAFPLEIRQYLCVWLETELINNTQQPYNRPESARIFFNQFLEQIRATAETIPFHNYTVKIRLLDSAENLRKIYESDPAQLYTHLCNCMAYEKKLLANPTEQMNAEVTINNSNNSTMVITDALKDLRNRMVDNQKANRILQREYENFRIFLNHYAERKILFDKYEMENPGSSTQLIAPKHELDNQLMLHINNINSKRINLIESFAYTLNEVEKIQNVVENFLCQWMRDQKLNAVKFIDLPTNAIILQEASSKLDVIQAWFECQAEILWITLTEIKTMRAYRSERGFSQYEQGLPDNINELQDKSVGLLEKLIVRSFIIEKQPAQIIIKEKNGGKRFSSTLRVLIGNSLNTRQHQVNVSIISEQQAHVIQATPNSTTFEYNSGEIVNRIGNLEYNKATNQLSAEFKNMQLKAITRGDKSGDDKIVDEKFSLFFQAQINVGDMKFAVWAMSLPIVVISHAKQNINAMATIIWDYSFSELYRKPFEEPEKVKWSQLAEVLNFLFTNSTGRGLTPNHLHFLCEKLMRQHLHFPIPCDFEVTRSQFCKDLIGAEFTFWNWFHKAQELMRENLRDEWMEGLVAGFINKNETESKLSRSPPGTFLLRFSESVLGGIVLSWIEYEGIKHLVPFVKKDLALKSISDCLGDFDDMLNLFETYQNALIPKDEAFGKFMSDSHKGGDSKSKNNYVARSIKVTKDDGNSPGSSSSRDNDDLHAMLENALMYDVTSSQDVFNEYDFTSQQNLPTFISSFSNIALSPASSY